MTADHLREHLRALAANSSDLDDPRVGAVLEVLAGGSVDQVAGIWAVDVNLLQRWVRSFLDAGAGQIINRPSDDAAEHRDRFLGAYAHEMRTPLAAARGWAEMLRDHSVPDDRVPYVLDRLTAALDRLAGRNRDVELLASSSLGRLDVRPRPITVAELTKGLDITSTIGGEGSDVRVMADPRFFPIVLRDVWQAAYTEPYPLKVRLDVATVDRWVELRVVRVAEPIEPHILQALFDPFDINDDGTGVTIGLYLARALTVAHGGTIGVDQDDTGAVLWVRVPPPAPATDTA